MPVRVVLTLTGCACLAAAAFAPAASAKRALAELRVEGPVGTLDPGTWYVTGGERIRRSRPSDACIRDQGRLRFPGATALGIAQTGSEHTKSLRQVRVRIDEAGAFVCEIGSVRGRPFGHPEGFSGWSYWLDYAFGSQSADLVSLQGGEQVLWVFSDFNPDPAKQANTGPVLELRDVPARDRDGRFEVRVVAHVFDGSTVPAEGATITGAREFSELGGGRYAVGVGRGRTTLTATRGLDVASNHVETCSKKKRKKCPRAHGRRIFGSGRADRLRGTRGWDKIDAGRGRDRINLRKRGRDKVDCGKGKDRVVVKPRDRDDRIARNCERVIRRK